MQATIHGVAKSQARLSDFTLLHSKVVSNVMCTQLCFPNTFKAVVQFMGFLSDLDALGY